MHLQIENLSKTILYMYNADENKLLVNFDKSDMSIEDIKTASYIDESVFDLLVKIL